MAGRATRLQLLNFTSLPTQHALLLLGTTVALSAICAIAVRFSREHKTEERRLYHDALAARTAEMQSHLIPDAATP